MGLRPRAQPRALLWVFVPHDSDRTVVVRGCCPTASVPKLLHKGCSTEDFSFNFCRVYFITPGSVSQISVPEVLFLRFLSQMAHPKIEYLLFHCKRNCFVSSATDNWLQPLKCIEFSRIPRKSSQFANTFDFFRNHRNVSHTKNMKSQRIIDNQPTNNPRAVHEQPANSLRRIHAQKRTKEFPCLALSNEVIKFFSFDFCWR